MTTPLRTVAILSISVALLALSRRADAQGVVAGSLTGGAVFNVPNQRVDMGSNVSITAERRSGLLGMGGGFEVVQAPAYERVYPQYRVSGDAIVLPLGLVFVGLHSGHRIDTRGVELFGQGSLAFTPPGFFPELRAGLDWWMTSRRAVRVAVHQLSVGERNMVMFDVGIVFR